MFGRLWTIFPRVLSSSLQINAHSHAICRWNALDAFQQSLSNTPKRKFIQFQSFAELHWDITLIQQKIPKLVAWRNIRKSRMFKVLQFLFFNVRKALNNFSQGLSSSLQINAHSRAICRWNTLDAFQQSISKTPKTKFIQLQSFAELHWDVIQRKIPELVTWQSIRKSRMFKVLHFLFFNVRKALNNFPRVLSSSLQINAHSSAICR